MSSTVERIIESAESQIRTGGYNTFSFREIAKEIGIKSASIHYHFPTKPDLAILVANRYTQRFSEQLDIIKNDHTLPQERLSRYIDLFRYAIQTDKKMCLCGILASETDALPKGLQIEVKHFFELNLQWIATSLFKNDVRANAQASLLVASLEGSLIISKAMNSNDIFESVSEQILLSSQH